MPLMREDQAEDEEQQHGDEQKRKAQHQQGCKRPEIIPGIFYGLIRHMDGMMVKQFKNLLILLYYCFLDTRQN
jgi:hypothetical protein